MVIKYLDSKLLTSIRIKTSTNRASNTSRNGFTGTPVNLKKVNRVDIPSIDVMNEYIVDFLEYILVK